LRRAWNERTIEAMVTPAASSFLRTVPLFSELDPSELDDVAELAKPFNSPAGTSLFRQGDQGDGMYVIGSGAVTVTTRLLGENKVALTQLGRGDVLGEMSLVDGRPRSASAKCSEATTGYFIRRSHFALLRADLNPVALRVMRSLARLLSRRLRVFNQEIATIKPPPERGAPARSIPPPLFSGPRDLPAEHLNRDAMRSIPLFAKLQEPELEQLLAFSKARVLPRGHVLFEQGQPGSSCFLTVRGAVRVALMQCDWSETLAILGPGRVFGHMTLLDDEPRSATCCVRENAIVLELRRDIFETWYGQGHPLAFELLEIMTHALVDGLRGSGRLMARFAVEGRAAARIHGLTNPGDELPLLPGPNGR
jgi:CRP-like cAMP-binding protein